MINGLGDRIAQPYGSTGDDHEEDESGDGAGSCRLERDMSFSELFEEPSERTDVSEFSEAETIPPKGVITEFNRLIEVFRECIQAKKIEKANKTYQEIYDLYVSLRESVPKATWQAMTQSVFAVERMLGMRKTF